MTNPTCEKCGKTMAWMGWRGGLQLICSCGVKREETEAEKIEREKHYALIRGR